MYFVASIYDVWTGTGVVVFNPGVNSKTIRIKIRNDNLVEGTEAFGVQLSVPNHHKSKGLKLGNISIATVFIKDGMFYSYVAIHSLCINHFVCTLTDDEAPATSPPTTSPTTQPTTKAPTTKAPTTKPSKICFVIYHLFILDSYVY